MAGAATDDGHSAVMPPMSHSAMMGAIGEMEPAADAAAQGTAALDICLQHCLAGAAILTEAPPQALGSFRVVQLAPDPESELASVSPDPTGPPPKSTAI